MPEGPKDDVAAPEPKADEATKEVPAKTDDAPKEKKSMFAMMCGCLGGSKPPADKDAKEAPKEATPEAEKEEVAETPAEPAAAQEESA